METLPHYLAYLGSALGILVIFAVLYQLVTPWNEMALIRNGNKAAAISLSGTLVGFGLALGGAVSESEVLWEVLLWGAIALMSQVIAFVAVTTLIRDFRTGIESDKQSYGILLAAISIAVGLINAGALTY
ncbi:MAG: DUF350 domain-containing protein [Alphaproteobacteria bacterium]